MPERGRAPRIVPAATLDQARRSRLVLRRSSRPRGRLRPLRSADRRRHAGRHDAAHLGEDLNVGCVLSWGPCWYYQKQFFEGRPHSRSSPDYLMRYDVEVSGFPSSHAGHLCLLRLKEDDYPGTSVVEDWPSWDLPILKWGKEQGGVVGFSHSGWGLKVAATTLPTYEMPAFDGIGANEYVVDVGPRRLRFHFGRRYADRVGTEHLVSHAQRRLSHAHQRRNRFPLHLWRSRRARTGLCEAAARSAGRLRSLGRRHSRRPKLLQRRTERSVRLGRSRPTAAYAAIGVGARWAISKSSGWAFWPWRAEEFSRGEVWRKVQGHCRAAACSKRSRGKIFAQSRST